MIKNAIAIIGISCLLPKANSPNAFWTNILNKRLCLREATEKDWRIHPDYFQANSKDFLNTKMGGFIDDVEPLLKELSVVTGYQELNELDNVFRFTLYTAYQALIDAKLYPDDLKKQNIGLILGNLSYPTLKLNQLYEECYLAKQKKPLFDFLLKEKILPINRHMSGLPALLTAKLLNLEGETFAIDAACASALYAVKLACDRLLHHQAKVMLAGSVNAADDLFIHMGFSALNALSPSGQSLPLQLKANGLIPAQGAGFVVLKRLEDALSDHDHIYGIIRSIGLSNDGKASGFLAPSSSGQIRAMKEAYLSAGLIPSDIDYVECHATGTQIGDKTELVSMRSLFTTPLYIGALKSSIGHSITVSTHAALLRILLGLKAGLIPPSRIESELLPEASAHPYQVPTEPIPWPRTQHLPRAAINGFGFGGCNAHAIIEAWEGQNINQQVYFDKASEEAIAIVGIEIMAGELENKDEFLSALLQQKELSGKMTKVELSFDEAKFPPKDLEQTLGQQLLILKCVGSAIHSNSLTLSSSTSVYVGMQCDADIARYSLRWRLPYLMKDHTNAATISQIQTELDAIIPSLTASHAIGAMPNILTNRINMQYDFQGPSYSVSSERLSGTQALKQAFIDLRSGDIQTAIVGAVEIGCEVTNFSTGIKRACDVAVVLILQKKSDALKANHRIYALFNDLQSCDRIFHEEIIKHTIGDAYCASSLLQTASAALCCYYGVWPSEKTNEPLPWIKKATERLVSVPIVNDERIKETFYLSGYDSAHFNFLLPNIYVFEKENLTELGLRSKEGKLVIVAQNNTELVQKINQVKNKMLSPGIFYVEKPVSGKIAPIFTGAHTSYYGMGRELSLIFSDLHQKLNPFFSFQEKILKALYEASPTYEWTLFDDLIFYSYLSQFHYLILRDVLQIQPDMMIGYCSGETNALFASGAWQDMAKMLDEIEKSEIYTRYLAGHFEVITEKEWQVYHVMQPLETVYEKIKNYPQCYLTIIDTPQNVALAGPLNDIKKLMEQFPQDVIKAHRYHMIIHCELVSAIKELWYQIHDRETKEVQLPHYSTASSQAYFPSRRLAAEALLHQALGTVNFPAVIKKAWEDGARIFIEHGPNQHCTRSVHEILKDKHHVAVAFDHKQKKSSLQLAYLAAELIANGLSVKYPCLHVNENLNKKIAHQYDIHWPAIMFDFNMPSTPLDLDMIIKAQQKNISKYELRALKLFKSLGKQLIKKVKHTINYKNKKHTFTRKELEIHAAGRISTIFGKSFEIQDNYFFQVRMPEPPLLLADRVTNLKGTAGKMGLGSITTETDVTEKAWYLHDRHMPPGIMIEAGQADLFLISWLGIDFLNKGKRVYRLLGCELTYHGGLATVGDTLCYDIHVDGHAAHGDVRLFFFHYDCYINNKLRLTVRHGQAGFFNDEELKNTKGIVWNPDETVPRSELKVDPPLVALTKTHFSLDKIQAFTYGKVDECFGKAFLLAQTHNETPRLPKDNLLLFDAVTLLNEKGGPWQRGYCKAHLTLTPNAWFFKGHFKNDPCMPGTLMLDGCFQLMAFYMTAMGYTLDKDGWRFEPVPHIPFVLQCRGQATPHSKTICYELFIEGRTASPHPQLIADVLVSVDGIKAFHGKGLALQLVRDFPLTRHPELLNEANPLAIPVVTQNDFQYDYKAMLAFAWGKPSHALSKLYEPFDQGIQVARMPGPPYNFMHGVIALSGKPDSMSPNSAVTIAYQIPDDAWYFECSHEEAMPFCVLLEIALQPCGWLASYVGCTLHSKKVLCFRNLDGEGEILKKIQKGAGTIITNTKLTRLSQLGDTFILAFDVSCQINQETVFKMTTSFGFFPQEAFLNQPGLNMDKDEQNLLTLASDVNIDLTTKPTPYFANKLSLASSMLLMIDQVTGYWPNGGAHGKGQLRAVKKVDANEWFFKAHFYLDPVQPGSLGLQAMIELLKFYLITENYHAEMIQPRWLPTNFHYPLSWKYRGQITPNHHNIIILMDIIEIKKELNKVTVVADASLWVDMKKIYHAHHLQVAIEDASQLNTTGGNTHV